MIKRARHWGVFTLLLVPAGACWAQAAAGYPAKAIRMVIALAPGEHGGAQAGRRAQNHHVHTTSTP